MQKKQSNIHREHEELFAEPGWLQVFVGQGVLPDAYHPLADDMPPVDLERMLADIERGIGGLVDSMPGHAQFLRAYCMPGSESAATMRKTA